jgi:hypothetical protein
MIYLFLAGGTKQFPLAYVLMTRRRTCDYVAVFERINQILGFPDFVEVIRILKKQFGRLYGSSILKLSILAAPSIGRKRS